MAGVDGLNHLVAQLRALQGQAKAIESAGKTAMVTATPKKGFSVGIRTHRIPDRRPSPSMVAMRGKTAMLKRFDGQLK